MRSFGGAGWRKPDKKRVIPNAVRNPLSETARKEKAPRGERAKQKAMNAPLASGEERKEFDYEMRETE